MRRKIVEIARDSSVGARSHLLATLSDLVFNDRVPTPEEVQALCGIAQLLMGIADQGAIKHFAGIIATNRHVPRDMIFLLLKEAVEIAAPILRGSPVLTPDDLINLAETDVDERLLYVAQRNGLGEDLVEIMVARSADLVLEAIAENTSARLSPKSLKLLVERAESCENLCQSLLRRSEVSKSDAEHLVQMIANKLKARMIAQAKGQIPLLAVDADPALAAATSKGSERFVISEIIAMIQSGKMSVDAAIMRLADDDRFNDLITMISTLVYLDHVSVMRLLVRADINGIGMILKALEISDTAFASVVNLRRRRLKSSEAQVRYEHGDYAKLTARESKATLKQLSGGRFGA